MDRHIWLALYLECHVTKYTVNTVQNMQRLQSLNTSTVLFSRQNFAFQVKQALLSSMLQ